MIRITKEGFKMKFAKILMAAVMAAGAIFNYNAYGDDNARALATVQAVARRDHQTRGIQHRNEAPKKLRKIWAACHSYAQTHQSVFPDDLGQLVKLGLLTPEDLISPLDRESTPAKTGNAVTEDNTSYIYLGKGLSLRNGKDLPLILEKRRASYCSTIHLTSESKNHYHVILSGGQEYFTFTVKHGQNGTNFRPGKVITIIIDQYQGTDKAGIEKIRKNADEVYFSKLRFITQISPNWW